MESVSWGHGRAQDLGKDFLVHSKYFPHVNIVPYDMSGGKSSKGNKQALHASFQSLEHYMLVSDAAVS